MVLLALVKFISIKFFTNVNTDNFRIEQLKNIENSFRGTRTVRESVIKNILILEIFRL